MKTTCGICGADMILKHQSGERPWYTECENCHIRTPMEATPERAAERIGDVNWAELTRSAPICCPFYVTHSLKGCRIECESAHPAEDHVRAAGLRFNSRTNMTVHLQKYCRTCWEECESAKTMLEKYDDKK